MRQNKNKTIPGRTQPVSSTSLVACYRPETKVRMKPELTSFLCVAMTTAAQSTCGKSHHPQGGNSQISPGNQNVISCYLHGNTKQIVLNFPYLLSCVSRRSLSDVTFFIVFNWMRFKVCCTTGRCRSRLSRLFPECHSLLPQCSPLSPGALLIHSHILAAR